MLSSTLITTTLAIVSAFSRLSTSFAFPAYESLAGLSERELAEVLPQLTEAKPGRPPAPLKFSGTKLVNDEAHPWKPLRRGDLRGPCPGLNTLASHGYLPRNGIATPVQIINAAQEGFNMEIKIATFLTYAGMLVGGNLVTDLLSIGGKTRRTGKDTPGPATIAGLNTHEVFEGDASLTRSDAYFGDNHSFNQTLFDQFVDFSQRYGGGFYDIKAASELRIQRINQSIATNPEFSLVSLRYFNAYADSAAALSFFVDGRSKEQKLSMQDAASFFRDSKFPNDFFRPPAPSSAEALQVIAAAYPVKPGRNMGRVNNYVLDPTSADFSTGFCLLYTNFVTKTVQPLYPNPKGVLRDNLITNLRLFYSGIPTPGCTEIFPYGRS